MPFWGKFYFLDGNSPVIEHILYFHDFSIGVLFSILVFLIFMIVSCLKSYNLDLYLIENQIVELVWTIIPVFLLLVIAFPSLRLLYLIEELFYSDLNIKIIAYQWYWSYEYRDFDLDFDSFIEENLCCLSGYRLLELNDYLFIPINCIIRFLLRSADVIHSWSIPSFGIKVDAIPGRLNQLNLFSYRPGVYFGQCSEICGINHSFIPICLCVLEIEDFLDEVS